MKVLECSLSRKEILAYMLLSLRNKKVELVLWFKMWYVYIFCFVFGKMNVAPILKESRIFNMCVITDTGYINTTMRKYNMSWELEYKVVSGHVS